MKFFSSLKTQATNFLAQYKQKSPATYAAAEQAIGGILIVDGLFGIDNPFGGRDRPGILGALVGVGIGVVFMFLPTFMGNISGTNKLTATTSATVVSVGSASTTSTSNNNRSTACPMTASYTVDGKSYSQQSMMSSSSYCGLAQGGTITINYNPSNPASWAYDVKTLNTLMQLFYWAGVLAVISSLITFLVRLFSIIFGWKLVMDGRKNAANLPQDTNLQTMIDEIKKNFTATVFGFGAKNPATPTIPTTQVPRS